MAIRFVERSSYVQKLTNNQLDMMNQLPLTNWELNIKVIKIANMRSQTNQLRDELISEKVLLERMHKPSKAIRYFEELMRSPRSSSDTHGFGHIKKYSPMKEGELSKSGEKIFLKPEGKPRCHHCVKLGHTTNICKRKFDKKNPKSKFISNYFNCKKKGYQEHEYMSKESDTPIAPIFEGNLYNYKNNGYKAQEFRSKEKYDWTSKKKRHALKKGNSQNWDYNTLYNYHYFGEYGHIP